MKNLEINKIAAAILVAGLIALVSGKIANFLYQPEQDPNKRGYAVEAAEDQNTSTASKQEEKEEALDIALLMSQADSASGAKLFKKCAACHSIEKNGANKVGPALFNIVGNKMAAHSGYAYSDALKTIGGTWGYDELFAFLKKPSKYVPGTKMTFVGIKKPKRIADLVAYLREQSDTPHKLPPLQQ